MSLAASHKLTTNAGIIADKYQQVLQALTDKYLDQQNEQAPASQYDPMGIGEALTQAWHSMLSQPDKLVKSQLKLYENYLNLLNSSTECWVGNKCTPFYLPTPKDNRFKDPAWHHNPMFDFIKQFYLMSAEWAEDVVEDIEGLDEKSKHKLHFYTRQVIDAVSPSNFLATNPVVLRETIETGGENLIKGLDNLLEDIQNSSDTIQIKTADENAFAVGENLAVTPGKVIFQNELMQLIQYTPSTKQVHKRPLLIIPPWINKYYILDLRPENSFVRFAVEQGFTVFMISWVNPTKELATKHFEDYMHEGPLAALNAIEKATGEQEFTAIGYCLGGTLLTCLLSYMEARGDTRIKAATYFTTLIDFTESGDMGVFIDEKQLDAVEEAMEQKGYFDGSEMAQTFSILRANDMIWSFVINNYLLGKTPFPFDILYWNADSTRLPAAMHSFYLRNMYLHNRLIEPGGISLDGTPIDISTIKIPSYFLSTKEDHIAPWKSTFSGCKQMQCEKRFVLSGSGHVAGVINPPAKEKYGYWTNNNSKKSVSADSWLKGAQENKGSWWPDWQQWNAGFSGPKVKARAPKKGIENAPGTYVTSKGD